MNPVLVWFRKDLRLADNPALFEAARRGGPVIPVFVWAPEEEAPWPPGGASRWWLHEALKSLNSDLAELGSRLVLREGSTHEVLLTLAREVDAKAVYWNRC
ncbi:MAG: deoxyribodipyrimidine photo-lyase, partial [Rubricoccaceae bacterium]|nr:deoxyribodipyrimidine photo-lyase [Rubricoccaceae bacterium]